MADILRTSFMDEPKAVVDAQSNFVPNRVLGTTPPELSSFECYPPQSVRTILTQLRSNHCQLLKSYKACITASMTDACPECEAPILVHYNIS